MVPEARRVAWFAAVFALVSATSFATPTSSGGDDLFVHHSEVAAATAPLLQLLERLQNRAVPQQHAQEQKQQHQSRNLAASGEVSGADVSGIRISTNNSAITMGTEQDVSLVRSAPGVLTVSDVLNVTNALVVRGVDVLNALDKAVASSNRTFCNELDASNATLHHGVYAGYNYAPTNGQYISVMESSCYHGYEPMPGNVWVCDEDGGVATPMYPLCLLYTSDAADE